VSTVSLAKSFIIGENIQLVCFLFISDQVFPSDEGDILFILTFLHSKHLIGFPGFSLKQCNRNSAFHLIIHRAKNLNLINVCH